MPGTVDALGHRRIRSGEDGHGTEMRLVRHGAAVDERGLGAGESHALQRMSPGSARGARLDGDAQEGAPASTRSLLTAASPLRLSGFGSQGGGRREWSRSTSSRRPSGRSTRAISANDSRGRGQNWKQCKAATPSKRASAPGQRAVPAFAQVDPAAGRDHGRPRARDLQHRGRRVGACDLDVRSGGQQPLDEAPRAEADLEEVLERSAFAGHCARLRAYPCGRARRATPDSTRPPGPPQLSSVAPAGAACTDMPLPAAGMS